MISYLLDVIIDKGSYKNTISKRTVDNLNLHVKKHIHLYH